jgi:hypothetical protein
MRLLILFLIGMTITPCFGKLGETLEQCEVRYGKPVEVEDCSKVGFPVGDKFYTFSVYGSSAGIVILNGVVVSEIFKNDDKSAFTKPIIEALLMTEAAGSTWTQLPNTGDDLAYTRKSDEARAIYDSSSRSFTIMDNQFFLKTLQKQVEAAKKNN